MCLICVDFQREKMTIVDAKRAYREMVAQIGPEHAKEVREMISDAETAAAEKAAAEEREAELLAATSPCQDAPTD